MSGLVLDEKFQQNTSKNKNKIAQRGEKGKGNFGGFK